MNTLSSIESVMIPRIPIFRLRYSPRDLAIVSEILIVARATKGALDQVPRGFQLFAPAAQRLGANAQAQL